MRFMKSLPQREAHDSVTKRRSFVFKCWTNGNNVKITRCKKIETSLTKFSERTYFVLGLARIGMYVVVVVNLML